MTKKRSNYQFYDHNVAAVPEASDLVALTGQLPWATHKCVLHRVLGRLVKRLRAQDVPKPNYKLESYYINLLINLAFGLLIK